MSSWYSITHRASDHCNSPGSFPRIPITLTLIHSSGRSVRGRLSRCYDERYPRRRVCSSCLSPPRRQTHTAACCAAFFGVFGESAIIDSNHWRHYFLFARPRVGPDNGLAIPVWPFSIPPLNVSRGALERERRSAKPGQIPAAPSSLSQTPGHDLSFGKAAPFLRHHRALALWGAGPSQANRQADVYAAAGLFRRGRALQAPTHQRRRSLVWRRSVAQPG